MGVLPKNHKLAVSPHNQFICRIGGGRRRQRV